MEKGLVPKSGAVDTAVIMIKVVTDDLARPRPTRLELILWELAPFGTYGIMQWNSDARWDARSCRHCTNVELLAIAETERPPSFETKC